MTEPGEFRLRRPVEADHARLVGQIDEWWGGRKVHAAPAAAVVPALHGHVLGGRGRATDRLVGFVVGFVSPDRPGEAYVHMIGTSPNHRRRGLGRTLYERFLADVAGARHPPGDRR